MARSKKRGMTERRRIRAAKALELRRDYVPYRDIAARLNVSIGTAHEDVRLALKEIIREPAEEVLTMELERLGHMHFRLSAEISRISRHLKADGDGVDLKAIDTIRKLIATQNSVAERRAKLLGLDMQRHEVVVDSAEAIREELGVIIATPESELTALIGEGGM